MIIKGLAVYTFIIIFVMFIMCFKERNTSERTNVIIIAFMIIPIMILSLVVILR